MLELFFPDPLYFVFLVRDVRHIVEMMACLDARLSTIRVLPANPRINYHPPTTSRQGLITRTYLISLYLIFGKEA